jgi:hypothetical protein
MVNDTLIFALEGEIPLNEFSKALRFFNALVIDLTKEVAGGAVIDWVVEELNSGSAIAKIQGFSDDVSAIENVIEAYGVVGEALESGKKIPYSGQIEKRAYAITDVLNGRITAIRFETPQKDNFIRSISRVGGKTEPIKHSIGTVKGTIQSLSMRRQLQFTLWDSIFDKAVNCYLKQGQEEIMREAWGKRAIVSGCVARIPESGLPINVRDITEIKIDSQIEPDSYRRAKGLISWKDGDKKSEEMVRSLRDD